MTNLAPLIDRNRVFAQTEAHRGLSPLPKHSIVVVTCMDARVDPAHVLGAELGDAVVIRNDGGRVTDAVLHDLAFVSEASVALAGGDAPSFEVAVIHHTGCGSRLLADRDFVRGFAHRVGGDEQALAALAVIDPFESVRQDVEKLQQSPLIPDRVAISGHVYDLETRLLSTVVSPGSDLTS